MGRIEEIEGINPPIKLRRLGDGELSLDGKIQLHEAKSAKRVAPKISLAEFGRYRKGSGIDSSSPWQCGILYVKRYTRDQIRAGYRQARILSKVVTSRNRHIDRLSGIYRVNAGYGPIA